MLSAMRCLIHGAAASRGGGGLTRINELVRDLPGLCPGSEFCFVLHPDLMSTWPDLNTQSTVWTQASWARNTPGRLLWERTVLTSRARRYQPDVVYSPFNTLPVHGWGRPKPALAVMVSNLAPYSRVCYDYANGPERRRNRVLRRLTDLAIRHADLVLLQSAQAFDLVSVPDLRSKAAIVPQAPPGNVPSERVASSRPYFVLVADLYKFKGVEIAVQALRLCAVTDARLIVVGRTIELDYERMLRALVRQHRIEARVEFTGYLPHETVLTILAGAQACLLTSRFENHSRVPTEAMSVKCPVIAADTPSAREACGRAAHYYSPDDVQRLALLMDHVQSSPGSTRDMVMQGSHLVDNLRAASGPVVVAQHLLELAHRRPLPSFAP